MKTSKISCLFRIVLGACLTCGITAAAETAYFSAQIGADMITVSSQMRYAQ